MPDRVDSEESSSGTTDGMQDVCGVCRDHQEDHGEGAGYSAKLIRGCQGIESVLTC